MKIRFALILLSLAATSLAKATTVTNGGIGEVWSNGIEATQTVNFIDASSGSFGSAAITSLCEGKEPAFIKAGLNTSSAIHTMLKKGAPERQQDFGNGSKNAAATQRGLVEMSLYGGGVIQNADGDDVFVTEGGEREQPEAFMLRVSTDSGATWSPWVYRFARVAYNPDGDATVAFITGFDLVKDFKLAPIAEVNRIQIQNCNRSDRVDNTSGEGTVVFAEDANYAKAFPLLRGPMAGFVNARLPYADKEFDPDIGYVFYTKGTPPVLPEPMLDSEQDPHPKKR